MRESEHTSNEMVVGFMEEQCGSLQSIAESQASPATDDSMAAQSNSQLLLQIDNLKGIISETSEEERSISARIVKYEELTGNEGERNSSSVMDHLRSLGLDAAICKSEPKHDRNFPPGKYEFMDVVVRKRKKNSRVMVDMDFRTQFEIARPSSEYSALIQLLPLLFVGNVEKLGKIVKIMSKSAKMSLKTKGMSIPPWRTYAYMYSKWLGSCTRITNHFPEKIVSESSEGTGEFIRSEDLSQKSSNQRMGKITSKLPIVLMEAGLTSMFKVVAVA